MSNNEGSGPQYSGPISISRTRNSGGRQLACLSPELLGSLSFKAAVPLNFVSYNNG